MRLKDTLIATKKMKKWRELIFVRNRVFLYGGSMKSKTINNSSSNNSSNSNSNSNSNNKYTERWIGLAAPLVTFPPKKLQSQSLKVKTYVGRKR